MTLAIIAITSGGAQLARRLHAQAEDAELWLPEKFRLADGLNYFDGKLSELLPQLFARVDGLICIMASGIVMRLLAPHLKGKDQDAAVVVCDEAGQFAISLLSGHLGGANELAEEVASFLGGTAVITTATDVNQLPAFDEVARKCNMAVEPLTRIKLLNRLLLEQQPIVLADAEGAVAAAYQNIPCVKIVRSFATALEQTAAGYVFVSNRYLPPLNDRPDLLALRPRNLAVGIGCNRDTSADEIEMVVRQTLREAFLAFASIGAIASIDAKQDEVGLLQFADKHRLPLHFYSADDLNAIEAPTPASDYVQHAVGAKGVCEPAALLVSSGGRMLVKKKKNGNVTVAIAEIKT
ncbi:cobalt-precorrin 5A hydrolase [Geopsychrobacter electrodiphilus]|uniref:cobalt-precorrin 5A hydrolase n=1 Tax=Geopsychrobacter electrodiphilus TaxID=225196 RepID=UPI00037D59E8|nr:cobalt-precorrin 5A hydrolase [Geopsychrobacter electrodiphilus]